MRKLLILILLLCLPAFGKGNRQDDPSYKVDHNRTKNFTPTVHFTQDQIDRVSDIFSGMTGNTFTINSDLGDVTSKLIFGRTTGGNAEISYNGTFAINRGISIAATSGNHLILTETSYNSAGIWTYHNLMGFGSVVSQAYRMNLDITTGQFGINTTSFIGTEKLRVNGNQYNDGTASLDALILREKSSDPADPAEGQSVIWQSDGTGAGDDGDLMVKITAGGVTKTTTLVDFSGI